MQTQRRNLFTTIHSEGAILPADLLQRIADGDRGLLGLTPESYHLDKGQKLNEATNHSWNRLVGAWATFKEAVAKLPAGDLGTTVTRERWLLPLFQELGYGRLLTAKAIEVEGKSYPISHSWHHAPVHLVGCQVDLDHRAPGVAGAARSSPHSLVQDLLNRSDAHLWGFVSNGLRLRILRDNASLTRQAYVEFDLEAMMEGEVYSDFVLLWLLCHQSRVEADRPEECWLEQWARAAQELGTRALDQLRNGVEEAISALGRGFLAYTANQALRDKLRSGALDAQDYYRQILRLVYRLLFLFVAEDRSLLLDTGADTAARERYTRFYSTAKLRRLAERRLGTRHADLFHGLRLVMEKLGSDAGCPELALPALGSFLFSEQAIPDLEGCEIANHDLLDAVRALAFSIDGHGRCLVDYKNLGSEELGSVYESLLELHPELNVEAGTFELKVASGHERKTTGSYYTHPSLVQCLLDSALDPVIQDCLKEARDAEKALLSLKICDPACGSGHFLIAAAHRMAKRLASIRTGDDEPSPEATRTALRDVIGRCIYGVDLNPMAVELCKVALWMEALEPGKPLSFLDHRIQCGNSLLGAMPVLLHRGIPDVAFDPIEGDNKEVCRKFRKQNKEERKGQGTLFDATDQPWQRLGDLAAGLMSLEDIADDTIEGVRRKQERYEELVRSSGYMYGRLWADAWCAAFVWKKTREFSYPITEEVFRRIERNPYSITPWMREEIRRLSQHYQFFHWHLAFPDVFRVPGDGEKPENEQAGWSGGFDAVLGNPPWERIQPEAIKFFAMTHPELLDLKRDDRNQAIEALANSDPSIYATWIEKRCEDLSTTRFLKLSGRFSLSTTKNVNSYAVFQELALDLLSIAGHSGLVLQSGIATDDINKDLFRHLISSGRLINLFDFENRLGLFPAVHSRMKFCLLTCGGSLGKPKHRPKFVFYASSVDELHDPDRRFEMSHDRFSLLAPNTGLCPTFRSKRDAELVTAIYSKAKAFIIEGKADGNPWEVTIRRIFSMAYDSGDFRSSSEFSKTYGEEGMPSYNLDWVPVYEAKLFHQFDHHFGYYTDSGGAKANVECRERTTLERASELLSSPRFWAAASELSKRLEKLKWSRPYLLGYRDVTNSTNERTCIASVLPLVAADDTIRLLFPEYGNALHHCALLANLNSYVLDYTARNTVASTHLSEYLAKQLPVLRPSVYTESDNMSLIFTDLWKWIKTHVLELTYTAWDLEPFAKDCGYNGPPFRWDEERRFLLRCELDAAYFHLYGISRSDVDYIMETFPIVKRKDEQKHGEYRTKRMILEIYDAMAEAIRTGKPYQTLLDPPPADPCVAHSPLQAAIV